MESLELHSSLGELLEIYRAGIPALTNETAPEIGPNPKPTTSAPNIPLMPD